MPSGEWPDPQRRAVGGTIKEEFMAQDYQARLRIPVDGDPAMRLFTRSGTLVADGYLRVVIGGRGPYIEFQTVWQSHLRVPAEELYRFNDPHVYYAEYRSHDKSNVKVYWQKKTVDYADYRVGRYYISPFDLVDGEEKDLIDPIARRTMVLQVTRVELI